MRRYHCQACDVLGNGETCWCCGSSDVEHSAMLFVPTG